MMPRLLLEEKEDPRVLTRMRQMSECFPKFSECTMLPFIRELPGGT